MAVSLGDAILVGAGLGLLGIGFALWLWERRYPSFLDRRWSYSFRRWGGAGLLVVALETQAANFVFAGSPRLGVFFAGLGPVMGFWWFKAFSDRRGPYQGERIPEGKGSLGHVPFPKRL
jgi:hypothetical protein